MKYNLPEIDQNKIYVLRKEAKNKIQNDEEMQTFIALNHIKEETVDKCLSKFIKVLDDRQICASCQGISHCKRGKGHYQLDLQYDEAYDTIENTIKPCKYEENRIKIKKNFLNAEFDESFLDYSLKECLRTFGQERKELILSLNNSYKNLKENMYEKSYFITGDPEVGKTFILVQFAQAIASSNLGKVSFINSMSYFDMLNKAIYNEKEYFLSLFEKIKNVEFLFIDDFGNEYKSPYIFENIIYPLLSYRLQRKLHTSFTSQFTLDEIKEMYTFSKSIKIKVDKLFDSLESQLHVFELRGMRFPK
ncbi:MAG: hypothetical protein ACI4U5_04750 [Bacilli bacterium]